MPEDKNQKYMAVLHVIDTSGQKWIIETWATAWEFALNNAPSKGRMLRMRRCTDEEYYSAKGSIRKA